MIKLQGISFEWWFVFHWTWITEFSEVVWSTIGYSMRKGEGTSEVLWVTILGIDLIWLGWYVGIVLNCFYILWNVLCHVLPLKQVYEWFLAPFACGLSMQWNKTVAWLFDFKMFFSRMYAEIAAQVPLLVMDEYVLSCAFGHFPLFE